MNDRASEYKELIERRLKGALDELDAPEILVNAMAHSLLDAGKRVRPIITMEFARLCGLEPPKALNAACALECIHTYSLIHDDLPCMDDDDFRRGKPSCHKAFGEANALLAGDALLTLAFELVTMDDVPAENKLKACRILASFAGADGMVGGQVLDLASEGKKVGIDTLTKLYEGKTCGLLRAACGMGCALAGGNKQQMNAADTYGRELGLAFQIIDDILDIIGDEKTLGKPIASDIENDKSTYVALLGLEEAKKQAHEHTENACAALECFGEEAQYLIDYARKLENRIN